jgi:hypothetical protein
MSEKRFNTLETIKILLEYPEIMLQAIQKMDSKGDHFIAESDLISKTLSLKDGLKIEEATRLESAFSKPNLFQSNVLVDEEKGEHGIRLIFHKTIINLFRLCDASLHRKITNAELVSHLKGLQDTYQQLEHSSFLDSDLIFVDWVNILKTQLSNLVGLLRINIKRMQDISVELKDISNNVNDRQMLFDKISSLFERHIRPILDFLNPKIRIKEFPNLFETLDSIKQKFDANDKIELAYQIHQFSITFGNMYQPIYQVADEVRHFLNKTRESILQYNAMEYYYQQLIKEYETTQERSLKKKWLDGNAFLNKTNFKLELKQYNRPKSYYFDNSPSYFSNFFEEFEQRFNRNQYRYNTIVVDEQEIILNRIKEKIQRLNHIHKLLDNLAFDRTDDLIKLLHNYLLENLIDNYNFSDLLTALFYISRQTTYKVTTTNNFRFVQIGNQIYTYRCRYANLIEVYAI